MNPTINPLWIFQNEAIAQFGKTLCQSTTCSALLMAAVQNNKRLFFGNEFMNWTTCYRNCSRNPSSIIPGSFSRIYKNERGVRLHKSLKCCGIDLPHLLVRNSTCVHLFYCLHPSNNVVSPFSKILLQRSNPAFDFCKIHCFKSPAKKVRRTS